MKHEPPPEKLSSDEQRKLRALLYVLTPIEMLEVIMEVIGRQRENAPRQSGERPNENL